jgi:aminopeptidase-like protein
MSNSVYELVEKLYPFNYGIASKGNDDAIKVFCEELPFKVFEYSEGSELNGWIIPNGQLVTKAEIRQNGKLIYDGLSHALGTISQCAPFKGRVDLETLKSHLYYKNDSPDAIVFHFSQYYKPGRNLNWGFCIPKNLYDSLEQGDYDIEIIVEPYQTSMKVLEYVLPGRSKKSLLLNGHNCHPFQANDDISGCAVGIKVMHRLAKLEKRELTYRLLIAPELIGPLFWLEELGSEVENIDAGIILAALGNDANLKLQDSFTGSSSIDSIAHNLMKNRYGKYETGGFREIYGNDETVFEAPGIEIPTISMTRYPWEDYHTSKDTPSRLSKKRLEDSLEAVYDCCIAFDRNVKFRFTKKGLYCLSNKKFNLYIPAYDPSNRTGPKNREEHRNWYLLMTYLPRLLDGNMRLITLSERFEIPIEEVYDYCLKWVDKGLLEYT